MPENNTEKKSQEEFIRKVETISNAFLREKKAGAIEQINPTERDSKIEEMLADIPREELREEARELVHIIQDSNRDERTKLRMAEKACKHILLSYMDNRDYLGMPNREFIEYKIFRFISESLDHKKLDQEDLYKVARINFDLNGLKVMNDVGGHSRGNIGLLIFSTIIKEGRTTKWLESQGIRVAASAEGGDEFGLILHGDKDLRPILSETEKRYAEEVLETRAIQTPKMTKEIDEKTGKMKTKLKTEQSYVDDIIQLDNPNDIKKLLEMGIIDDKDKQMPRDFKFQLGTSVGSSTFGEALGVVGLEGTGSYKEMVERVINQMFKMADRRAIIHKDETKKKLETENPTLFRMYTRVGPEIVELNKKLLALSKKIEELSAINIEERRKREEIEKEMIRLKSELLKRGMEESKKS